MRFIVSNKIKVEDYTQDVAEYCSQFLVVSNPEYYKKEAMGKWTGNTQKEFVLYEKNGRDLLLPFGCFKDLWKRFGKSSEFVSRIKKPDKRISYNSDISLYDYQKAAVNAVFGAKNGILVSPCGSGKTQMALEIVARVGGRALWLTHTGELLTQSMERAKSVYCLDKSQYGTITAGKVNIGSAITFATVQTMSNIDIRQYAHEWDIVIVDECQHCVGSPTRVMQFYKVLSNLSARHKIGVTATPKRSDGMERCMFALLGDIIYEIDKKEVEKYTCPVKVEKRETGYVPDMDFILSADGTIIYSDLIKDLTADDERNEKIASDVCDILRKDAEARVLILSDRVAHLAELRNRICEKNVVPQDKIMQLLAVSGSNEARKRRRQALVDLNDGKTKVLLATYQLAKEGLDVPQLRYVVFATPQKDQVTVTQAAGRVGRKADGKSFGTVIDYTDNGFGVLAGFSKKRNSIYKKLKYEVCVI